MNASNTEGVVHFLDSIHAAREGDTSACSAAGTKRVTTKDDDVTCDTCRHWIDAGTHYLLSDEAQAYVESLGK